MASMPPSHSTDMMTCSLTASSASTCIVNDHHRSIYARAWRFVQRRLHLRPRACSCPVTVETTDTVEHLPMPSSETSNWDRVHMFKEIKECHECVTEKEVQPRFRTQAQHKVAQITCCNCGLLFFQPLSIAPDASAFCGRDCQSTFEYRRDLLAVVNECESFQAAVNWTRSREL